MRRTGLVLLVLLAACNSAAAPSAEAGSPRPSPTPDLEALRDAYVEIAEAANAAQCEFSVALNDSPSDVGLIQERARQAAEAYGVAAVALRALTFPPELQPDVDALIEGRETLESDFMGIADAPNAAAMERAIDLTLRASSQRGSATSNRIREALGLPQTPRTCDQ